MNASLRVCSLCFAARRVIAPIALCISSIVVAQAQDGASASKYDNEFVRQKINQHTIRASSGDDAGVIPSHIYYEVIFKDILNTPEINASIPSEDWVIIQGLPSKFDRQFLEVDLAELNEICQMAQDNGIPDMSLAAAFDLSRTRSERALDEHYANVISSLSDSSRKYVETRRRELLKGNRIGYAMLDMASLEADAPGISRGLIARRCPQLLRNLEVFSPVSRKLSDEISSVYPVEFKQ